MILVWGTRRLEKRLGCVAEFCPICRSLQVFDLSKITATGHIYFVTLGSGQILGHLLACRSCGTRLPANPGDYLAPVKKVRDLEALIQASQPRVRERHAARLELEQKILSGAGGQLTGEVREHLLLEPFQILAPEVEARYGQDTTFDRRSGLGCLGTVGSVFSIFILGLIVRDGLPFPTWLIYSMLVIFGAGTVVTLVLLFLGPRHFLHTVTLPRLARALRPLGPNRHELGTCLERMAAMDFRIGKKLRLEKLWAAVAEDRSPGRTSR